jgi:hypothetical protein
MLFLLLLLSTSLIQYLTDGRGQDRKFVFSDVDCMVESQQEYHLARHFDSCLKPKLNFTQFTATAGMTTRRDVGYAMANVCVILASGGQEILTNNQQKITSALYARAADLNVALTIDAAVDTLLELTTAYAAGALPPARGVGAGDASGDAQALGKSIEPGGKAANPIALSASVWGGAEGVVHLIKEEQQGKRAARAEDNRPCRSRHRVRSIDTGRCERKSH